jgi:hypothetical protein
LCERRFCKKIFWCRERFRWRYARIGSSDTLVKAVERFGGAALLVDAENRLRELRMVRVNDIVLVDQPADHTGPRCINCYLVEGERTFKFDPTRLLYSLQWLHKATPPDFHLQLLRDPREWFDAVSLTLLAELSRHDPQLRDRLSAPPVKRREYR